MKIAMIGQKSIPSSEGGIEVVVEELATRMVEKGHEVTCFNRYTHKNKETLYKGIKLKQVLTINVKGLAAASSSIFASIRCSFGQYDVVHYHAEGSAFLCWLPKLMGKKVVVTIHGLDYQRKKWNRFASWYIRMGERAAVKHANEIIVLSKNTQEYFIKKHNRKTLFIPNGINRPIKEKPQIINDKYGLKKNEYILYMGRIVPEKGIDYLICAYKKINTKKKLVIAGSSGDTKKYLDRLKQLSKDNNRILFIGQAEGETKYELFSNAYLFVLPSDLEGMSISLLEAISYGNCCLCSDIEENKEVVEDKAIVFKKGNIDDLKLKLELLINNPEIVKQYRNKVSKSFINKYNWDSIVEKTLNLYKQN